VARLLQRLDARGHGRRELLLEPGRSLVGNAGVLLTEVLYLKPEPEDGTAGGGRSFCIVDAAMNDLMRPAMYEAWMAIEACVQRDTPPRRWDVVGPVCESGDWLGRDRLLAVAPGDLLAVLSAGAYGMAMASNYNTRPRAAEVILDGEQAHLIREREAVTSLFAGERLLPDAI
jgi:diaminopimelate decarboxylase